MNSHDSRDFRRFAALAPVIAVAGFLVTRLALLLYYDEWVSDLPFYFGVATKVVVEGQSAYCDFHFPYPPLSLPFLTFPGHFASSYDGYRDLFRLQMFLVDILCAVLVWRLLTRRLELPAGRSAFSFVLYCSAGLLVGHLIYDRLDLLIALSVLAWLYFFTGTRHAWPGEISALAGTLVKVVPIFLLPLFVVADRIGGRTGYVRRSHLARPLLVFILPLCAFLALYSTAGCGRLMESLSDHRHRGIEIGSTWATPYLIQAATRPSSEPWIEFNFGALHLAESLVPPQYVFFSKYSGFVALALVYCLILLIAYRPGRGRRDMPPRVAILLAYSALIFVIATQRVFSPQYLVWILPAVGLLAPIVRRPGLLVALFAVVLGLSWIAFDIGFHGWIHAEPVPLLALSGRNIVILILSFHLLGEAFLSLSREYGSQP